MDILIMFWYLPVLIAFLYIATTTRIPYIMVLSGVLLIFTGIFFVTDGNITKQVCSTNPDNWKETTCYDYSLPTFDFWDKFTEAVGLIFMILGSGLILDASLYFFESRKKGMMEEG